MSFSLQQVLSYFLSLKTNLVSRCQSEEVFLERTFIPTHYLYFSSDYFYIWLSTGSNYDSKESG